MRKPVKKRVSRLRVAACALLLMAALADTSRLQAAETPHAYTLNVSTGGFRFSGQDDLSHRPVYDIRLGYDIMGTSIADSLGIEGGLSYIPTKSTKDNTEVRAYLMRIDATYPFRPRKRLVPFLAVGAGGMLIERATKTDASPVLAYGGGMKYFLKEYMALRFDLRQNILFNVGSRNDFQYMLGLSFLFDRDQKIRRLPLPPPPPAEKKGPVAPAVPVIDFEEQEPGKKEPEKPVEPETPVQLPLPAAVIAAPVAAVTGLLNPPEQPKAEPPQETPPAAAPTPVAPPKPEPPARTPLQLELAEPFAAPLPDANSQEMIESILCPIDPPADQKQRVLKKPSASVFFDNGSAVIKPQFVPELNRIAAYVKKHPGSAVHIEGHTDLSGTSDRNVDLSRARMINVRQALLKRIGKVKVKLTERAFGCRLPVESNREEKGRSKNRRATIEVTPP